MRLRWTFAAVEDRDAIYDYVEAHNARAATTLDMLFSQRAAALSGHPFMGRPGRVQDTRELVVHRNYLLIYDLTDTEIRILRFLHAARRWSQHQF